MNTQMVRQTAVMTQGLLSGEPLTMSSREIASLCEKDHKTVLRDIRVMLIGLYGDEYLEKTVPENYRNRHSEYIRENVDKIMAELFGDGTNWSHQNWRGFSWRRDSRGYVSVFHLDKEHSLTLVAGYNVKLRHRIVQRWMELEQKRVAPHPVLPEKVTAELAIAECFTRMLRPAPSSQVAMLQRIAKNNGVDSSFLPGYAVDAAPDATGGSSMPTKALSELLKDHGINYTARSYNLLLRDIGMLEERTRKTNDKNAPGGIKRFWSITDAGLVYGKNITSPSSPRETQPHWYVGRFADLHALVVKRMEGRR